MNIKHIQKCRVCGNEHLAPVLDLGYMHIQGAFETKDGPNPPRRKIPNEIVRCDTSKSEDACGTVQAKHTISPEILYRSYFYSSGVSETMRNHLKWVVSESIKTFRGDQVNRVLDIACNDGTLLRNYTDKVEKWGVDPSDIAGRQFDFNIINECWPTQKLNINDFDIITTIACFYDVDKPVDFAKSIASSLKRGGIWVVELAYWPEMLNKLAYDQILGEHLVHYSLGGLETVCAQAGLKVFRAIETPTNGGSIMIFACHDDYSSLYENKEWQNELRELHLKEFEMALDDPKTYCDFATRVQCHAVKLFYLIRELVNKGHKVAILGASTKLNTILGHAKIRPDLIQYAVERSPEKHGGFTMDGIEMISEEEAKDKDFDYYLVGPYSFKDQLLEREKPFLEKGGKLIFPLPQIQVYDKNGLVKYE